MPATTHRFRKAATSLGLLGILSITACAPLTTDATATSATSTAATATSETITTAFSSATATAETSAETAAAAAEAAQAFLDTLNTEELAQVQYDSVAEETRSTSWSNFPVTQVERSGMLLTDLSEDQRTAAMAVLEAMLSEEGYQKVVDIMGSDQAIVDAGAFEGKCGGTQYAIGIFGDPASGEWALQFGGHHLGLNATVVDGTITLTPTHTGAQPTTYTNAEGEQVEVMAEEYEDAFAFYDSLDEEQLAQMHQGEQVSDLTCQPGSTCAFATGTGIAGADLDEEQKELLLELVGDWVGIADEATAAAELAEIEASLEETWISWSGATAYDTSTGDGIAFTISGPDVYIEFANQAQPGDTGGLAEPMIGWQHVHTIYRDPANDYAGTVEQQEATGGMGPGGAPAQ